VKSTLVNINVSQTKIDYTANIKHLKNEIGLILYFCNSVQLQVLLCVQFFKREVQENVVQADWCLKWCTYTTTAWVMHWLCDVEFWSTMLGSCWVHKFWVITIMYMLKAMDATLVYKHDIYIYMYIYGETYIIYSEKFVCSVCSCLSGCVIAHKPLMKAVQQSKRPV